MIWTSSYNDFQTLHYKVYSISGDRGKLANYKGKCYPALAPKHSFWKVWHDNIGKISEEENTKYYIEEYWNQVLSKLDPEEVFNELEYSVLLCYEPVSEFCHRHIVAAWFEILLGKEIKEIKAKDYIITGVKEERPAYIKEYLEEAMRKNRNMRGFTSLRALYLFEKGEKLAAKARKLKEKNDMRWGDYEQEACFLRCDADMAEEEYREMQRQKRLSKK